MRKLRIRPVEFIWDGNVMIPNPRFKRLCDQQFAINEAYPLVILENRSMASHNHYFAALQEGFNNLAEEYAQEFDSVEHMRHWCLCMEGFCTQTRYELNTADDARTLRQVLKDQDQSTIVKVTGSTVTVYAPESQSMAAMKKDKFEESKDRVLARVAAMARTTPAELKKNAGRSA